MDRTVRESVRVATGDPNADYIIVSRHPEEGAVGTSNLPPQEWKALLEELLRKLR